MEKFHALFPSEHHLLSFFAPCKWEGALAHPDKCLLYDTITLYMLEDYYITGTAKMLVRNNMASLFTLFRPNEFINHQQLEDAVKLFIGKYGHVLSPFAMLYYFANYTTEYKNSYGQFDFVDVLRQCSKVFVPWWTARCGRSHQNQQHEEEKVIEETGFPALCSYLRREYVSKGLDIRTSAIYQWVDLTPDEIRFIESGQEVPF